MNRGMDTVDAPVKGQWVYVLRWNNPHTEPPNGCYVLAEARVPEGSSAPPEFMAKWIPGGGYGVHLDTYHAPPRRWSEEAKASARAKRERNRIMRDVPLFADQYLGDQ